ncbi:MAG: hypothetical protein A2V77_01725 [Anaeromyxobacter sp. RBG_16_69_14]|nr:MAG: hypothetical protein A2V77_01725 [Anaeromyxobacter sp. RBG_16_69_14]
MYSTGSVLLRCVVSARLASGVAYHDVLGHPLYGEQDVVNALERDHLVHYRLPPAVRALVSARDGFNKENLVEAGIDRSEGRLHGFPQYLVEEETAA